MSKKTENTPAVFVAETRAFEIHKLMLQGLSVVEIAAKIGTPEENIRRTISQERLKLTAGMQEMQEQHMALTYARVEWLISKVFPVIEQQSTTEAGPDKNLLKVALDIMKFENEVVNPKNIDKTTSPDVVINQTFVSGSAMYDEAMQEMQSDFLESIRVEKAIPMTIQASPEMIRLEDLAEKHLPKGFKGEEDEE